MFIRTETFCGFVWCPIQKSSAENSVAESAGFYKCEVFNGFFFSCQFSFWKRFIQSVDCIFVKLGHCWSLTEAGPETPPPSSLFMVCGLLCSDPNRHPLCTILWSCVPVDELFHHFSPVWTGLLSVFCNESSKIKIWAFLRLF